MANTNVDLKIGLNLTIGSVPVSLDAEYNSTSTQTVYTFNGCVQDAVISLGEFISFVGQQFGINIQLPPELNLKAKIDYVAGQVIYTQPQTGNATTQLGINAKFELSAGGDTVTLEFYADAILQNPAPPSGNPFVIGAAIDTDLQFSSLPLVGDIPGFRDLALTHMGFSYTNNTPSAGAPPVTFSIPQVTVSDNPLFTRNDQTARDAKTYAITSQGNQQSFNLSTNGFSLTVGLEDTGSGTMLNNFALPMSLPPATPPPVSAPSQYYPEPTSPPASPVHWVDINKTFGPVNLQKIGLNYSQGEATFGFSAGFALGTFSFFLEGLSITFPLPLPTTPAGQTVSFDLEGLALNFQVSGVSIGGAFLRMPGAGGVTNYYGEVMVQAGTWGFKAMGGYTPAEGNNPASFFLYVNLEIPLGGPPFLFVTGVSGGLGINRTLILPTISTLQGYILLPANAPPQAATPSATINQVLPQLQSIFIDQPGEYWVAAGISFTSFEMIDAFALLTVSFGVDFQLGLLGTCTMVLPTGDPFPIAYVQIDILASLTPSTGLFAIQGQLSPQSYIYGGFARLSGGFAFFIWFGGEHKGDFVVSLGGYNSAFHKPDWYPTVPRLGISFGFGPFQVLGQCYFALTPAMMMAGAIISATWNSGPIKAWFNAGVDFLIAWAPFFYQADAYVTIGCSVNIGLFTLNVHVGADVLIWGPPFGGRADVDLDVVAFTISFGAPAAAPPPVGWAQFKSNFLPENSGGSAVPAAPSRMAKSVLRVAPPSANANTAAPPSPSGNETTNVIKASVSKGLLQSNFNGYDWVVDSDNFAIVTNSTIPSNNGQWQLTTTPTYAAIPNTVSSYNATTVDVSNGPYLVLSANAKTFSATQVWNPTLNIGPMNQSNVQSYSTISLLKADSSTGAYNDPITTVSCEPLLMDSSAALWNAQNPSPNPNDQSLLPCTLVGFQITPIPRTPDSTNAVPLIDLLFARGFSTGFVYQAQAVDPSYTVAPTIDASENLIIAISGAHTATLTNQNYILSSLADTWVSSQRAAIADDLAANGFSTYTSSELDITALSTQKALMDWPMVELLGAGVVAA